MAEPAGDAHHFHRVVHPFRPKTVGMRDLVRQGELVAQAFEVTDRGVDIDRFDRVAGHQVDAVEILGQTQQVCALLPCARYLLPNLKIIVVWWGRNVAE